MENKRDTWFYVGKNTKFYPYSPTLRSISIGDIAHALSNQVRFLGHVSQFYSVSEHSVLVLRAMEADFGEDKKYIPHLKHALMHDTAEAFLNDMPTPLKRMFPDYQKLENIIFQKICQKYRMIWPIPIPMKKLIKYYDSVILATEVTKLKKHTNLASWGLPLPLNNSIIHCFEPTVAKIRFLWEFRKLFGTSFDSEIFCDLPNFFLDKR